MMNVMTRAQIGGKDATFEVTRTSGHLEHGIYTSELCDPWMPSAARITRCATGSE